MVPQIALYGAASPTPQDSQGGQMKRIVWEMQPLGWLLVIVETVCYGIVSWVRRVPPAPEQEA